MHLPILRPVDAKKADSTVSKRVDRRSGIAAIITEAVWIADLRGLSRFNVPNTDNCVHPMYRDYLHRYLKMRPNGHIH